MQQRLQQQLGQSTLHSVFEVDATSQTNENYVIYNTFARFMSDRVAACSWLRPRVHRQLRVCNTATNHACEKTCSSLPLAACSSRALPEINVLQNHPEWLYYSRASRAMEAHRLSHVGTKPFHHARATSTCDLNALQVQKGLQRGRCHAGSAQEFTTRKRASSNESNKKRWNGDSN